MKILHLTHHNGCAAEIEYVIKKIFSEGEYELTTLRGSQLKQLGGPEMHPHYVITSQKAKAAWEANKAIFECQDIIITSDTAPLSRIFIEGGYKGRLVVWVCNRFDYAMQGDPSWVTTVKEAIGRSNITFAGYTPFEAVYAKKYHGIDWGRQLIRPTGGESFMSRNSAIPENIVRRETFFIPPYHNDTKMMDLPAKCRELGIPVYCGKYNGPGELVYFKGIIHIPYTWSTLALFEQAKEGTIHFIPTRRMLDTFKDNFFWSPPYDKEELHYSEFYHKDNEYMFIYFDSWEDLADKVKLDYAEKARQISANMRIHEEKQLYQWKILLK